VFGLFGADKPLTAWYNLREGMTADISMTYEEAIEYLKNMQP
jgi:hypothetical protein